MNVTNRFATESYVQQEYPIAEILQAVYPVGSIYITTSSVSPSVLFGFGTWEQIEDVFLLGAGSTYTAGGTGGEANVTLTQEQTPNVIGDITLHSGATATNISNVSGCFSAQITNTGQYRNGGTIGDTAGSIGIVHFDNGG